MALKLVCLKNLMNDDALSLGSADNLLNYVINSLNNALVDNSKDSEVDRALLCRNKI